MTQPFIYNDNHEVLPQHESPRPSDEVFELCQRRLQLVDRLIEQVAAGMDQPTSTTPEVAEPQNSLVELVAPASTDEAAHLANIRSRIEELRQAA